jgi:hypothetical protein
MTGSFEATGNLFGCFWMPASSRCSSGEREACSSNVAPALARSQSWPSRSFRESDRDLRWNAPPHSILRRAPRGPASGLTSANRTREDRAIATHELRLYREDFAAGGALEVAETDAVVARYVVSGTVRVRSDAVAGAFSANSAFMLRTAHDIQGGSAGAVALRWELARAADAPSVSGSEGLSSTLLLTGPLSLEQDREYLLRCDRVDFPPGGVALLHTHQGGGIRCLLQGSIEIETQGARHGYGPLEPWFEAGPDPVFAAASKTECSAFARVMILPRALLGKSSIAYVRPEDLAKPKNQMYQVFIDAPVDLPR